MRNVIRADGRIIPLTIPYSSGVQPGDGVLVGGLFGVALSAGAQNSVVDCAVEGEFELAKQPSLAISAGARVYWDDTNRRITTTATGNFHVAICTVAAAASDSTVRVLLKRVPAAGE